MQNLIFNIAGCVILTLINADFKPSPPPGTGRGDERMIDQNCTTAPTANLDNTLSAIARTVTTVRGAK